YSLYNGNLNWPTALILEGGNNSFSSSLQTACTNLSGNVFLEPGLFGGSPSFTFNGGLLGDNNVTLEADDFGGITFTQNGGTHVITNTLFIAGSAPNGNTVTPANYNLNGGTLSAGV